VSQLFGQSLNRRESRKDEDTNQNWQLAAACAEASLRYPPAAAMYWLAHCVHVRPAGGLKTWNRGERGERSERRERREKRERRERGGRAYQSAHELLERDRRETVWTYLGPDSK
jgi:hypothetical protein